MTEEIKGLHVKDYHDLDVQALEEIIQLDNQLEKNLEQIREAITKRKRIDAMRLLDMLLTDNTSHRDYCIECQGDVLTSMYEVQTQDSREPDPCEIPDYDGIYNCPFDSQGPDDCRRHCGLGVDE